MLKTLETERGQQILQPIEEIELGTRFEQDDPDADLYTPWGQWGPCCPTSETITEQTRSRACLDDQAYGGTKCQDYRNKSYQKRVSESDQFQNQSSADTLVRVRVRVIICDEFRNAS